MIARPRYSRRLWTCSSPTPCVRSRRSPSTATSRGRRLAAFAEDSLRRVGDLVAELTQEQSLVRVAAGRGTLRWVISPAIRSIARKGGLQVITADRGAALAALTAGQADVAVVA